MATVTLKGKSVIVAGSLPRKGEGVSDFSLTGKDLGDVSLKNCAGKRKVLHSERVPEIASEPNYEAALAAWT